MTDTNISIADLLREASRYIQEHGHNKDGDFFADGFNYFTAEKHGAPACALGGIIAAERLTVDSQPMDSLKFRRLAEDAFTQWWVSTWGTVPGTAHITFWNDEYATRWEVEAALLEAADWWEAKERGK